MQDLASMVKLHTQEYSYVKNNNYEDIIKNQLNSKRYMQGFCI